MKIESITSHIDDAGDVIVTVKLSDAQRNAYFYGCGRTERAAIMDALRDVEMSA